MKIKYLTTNCGDFYYLNREIHSPEKETINITDTWNNYGCLNVASKQFVNGLSSNDVSDEMGLCESCVFE